MVAGMSTDWKSNFSTSRLRRYESREAMLTPYSSQTGADPRRSPAPGCR